MNIPFDIKALRAAIEQKLPNVQIGFPTDDDRCRLPHVVDFLDVSPERTDYYAVLPRIRAKLYALAGRNWLLEGQRSHGGGGPVVSYAARLSDAAAAAELRRWWESQ